MCCNFREDGLSMSTFVTELYSLIISMKSVRVYIYTRLFVFIFRQVHLCEYIDTKLWGINQSVSQSVKSDQINQSMYCCTFREVSLYEYICTKLCALVASCPAQCFHTVVSTSIFQVSALDLFSQIGK